MTPQPTMTLKERIEARLKETIKSRDSANAKRLLGVDSDESEEWEYLKDPILQLNFVLAAVEAEDAKHKEWAKQFVDLGKALRRNIGRLGGLAELYLMSDEVHLILKEIQADLIQTKDNLVNKGIIPRTIYDEQRQKRKHTTEA